MSGLTVEDISHDWGARRALDGVSFTVERGRFCALLGPNGAGKSTLFGMLTRLFTPRTGRIAIAGHDMASAPRAALARMGVVFQASTLDPDLTVRRNLLYFAALHGLSGREAETRAMGALERLGMAERAEEKAARLNGGHRRRMEIARALIHRPDVLLLDEPTVGLDAASRAAITQHVHDLASGGLTVLWATHLVDEVRPQDRLVILHHGRVLADGEAGDIGGTDLTGRFLALTGDRP
ncbi:ABC transporter ATP-binding protein [Shinella sp.]|uniref:ABC transporter ATP-binding protein n=1 Tax=Shinella sp. TaxID=1870904 RepID=UPI003F6FE10E